MARQLKWKIIRLYVPASGAKTATIEYCVQDSVETSLTQNGSITLTYPDGTDTEATILSDATAALQAEGVIP